MSSGLTLASTLPPSAGLKPRPSIPNMFERQARLSPDAVAVNWLDDKLTYRELNEQANQLAHHLQSLGVGPEIPVALYLDRTPKMVVAILGVLKAGGAYLPIDLAYPKDRVSFMLEDAQPPVLLTQASLRASLPAAPPRVICLDSDWPSLAQAPVTEPLPSAAADDAAYIIYTSGSTGKPKGVIVTHHNVVRLLQSTAHWYGFSHTDVWPLFHSYAFDVSVWELWGSLFNGGRLVVVPYLVTRTPSEFYKLLAREKVTVLNQTPSAFRQLIWAEENAPEKLDLSLRYVICAGEALELQSLKPWFERHGDEKPRIVNMYGITETTVHSSYRVIRQADLTSGVGSVIGVPIPDLQLYLVDDDLKPVPAGTPGEICVGGAGVARGYLNRPELTAKRFISDPFSPAPGARMYRSGDLAQVNAHGELEYLGRMDHQVKIRGFRVELGEIESALNRHPAIRESVVVAQDDSTGGKRLIAYAVPVQTAPTVTELREFLGQKIPDYMLPAVFVFLPAFPLTTNGKVDRRALPQPEHARPVLKTSFVAPRNPAEQTLAAIWSEVLAVDKIGVDDNFFELGGDSIRSISVLAKAQQKGIRRSLEQIFRWPTVAGLAACGDPETGGNLAPTEPFSLVSAQDRAAVPPDVEDAYPITRLQLGMFFHNELDPVSAMYHDVFSYRIRAAFEQPKLEEALARLAARHPLLRTSFHLAGFSQPLQLVHREVRPPFSIVDLRALLPAQQDQQLVAWVEAEKRRPFNRAEAPLCRFHVQRRAENSFQFIISFHHSCLDGWSLAAVITELFQDYAALLRGNPQVIAPPQLTYRDFVALEQRALTSDETRSFWAAKLSEVAPQSLPRWPANLCAGGHEQCRGPELQIPEPVLAGLKSVAQSAGVPLKTVLLATHLRVMSFLQGQPDVVTGLISNGRPEVLDGEKLVGLFLNTVPLRQQLQGGTWVDLVRQTFAAEQELMPHRRFPLAEAQKLAGGQTLFESAFDFVHFHVLKNLESCREVELTEGHYFEANNLPTYTTFMLDVTSTHLELHIDYDPNILCRRQVEEISDYYLRALAALAADPDAQYQTASLLSEPESDRILRQWNATAAEYPRQKGLAQLFEEQVARSPEAVALVFQDRQLTYAELDRHAGALAARLRQLNVGPGALVGLYVERSPEMLVALLGTLKAGAAYVPMDPAYPAERLAYMLQDCQPQVLITQTQLQNALPKTAAKLLLVDAPEARLDAPASVPAPHPELPAAQAPEQLAYVIYTSGSTGKPKGVQVLERAVVNLLTSVERLTGFSARDNFLAVTTLSFDIAGLELFLPLLTGGRLTLATREQAGDGTQLAALLASSDATFMQATPATWRLLLESGWRGKPDLTIFCGGEALKRSLADALLARAKDVWNFYGPTETTIWSTAWKVVPGEPVTIGRPLANTRLYILDARLQPVPVGAVGELHIGGDGVARGYLNQPELTTAKFVSTTVAGPSERIYKTGDLARYLPDGRVECLGRVDHQLKIRGFRIEAGEVESVLRQHAAIADCLVTAREDGLGEKRLIGYVISRNGPPSPLDLRDFLKTRLPQYMVPAHFVVLKQFPLTPNGKIDRRSLPAPETAAAAVRDFVPPQTPEEQALAGFWQEVLALKQVGAEDNFFDVGGDSLSATRVFARINRTFATELTLREILDHPTIRSLAELVKQCQGTASSRLQTPIRRQPRLSPQPASPQAIGPG